MAETLELTAEQDLVQAAPLSRVDPYFEVVGNNGLMHDQKPATDYHSTLMYLLSNIKREPLKLELHIQRILSLIHI